MRNVNNILKKGTKIFEMYFCKSNEWSTSMLFRERYFLNATSFYTKKYGKTQNWWGFLLSLSLFAFKKCSTLHLIRDKCMKFQYLFSVFHSNISTSSVHKAINFAEPLIAFDSFAEQIYKKRMQTVCFIIWIVSFFWIRYLILIKMRNLFGSQTFNKFELICFELVVNAYDVRFSLFYTAIAQIILLKNCRKKTRNKSVIVFFGSGQNVWIHALQQIYFFFGNFYQAIEIITVEITL